MPIYKVETTDGCGGKRFVDYISGNSQEEVAAYLYNTGRRPIYYYYITPLHIEKVKQNLCFLENFIISKGNFNIVDIKMKTEIEERYKQKVEKSLSDLKDSGISFNMIKTLLENQMEK